MREIPQGYEKLPNGEYAKPRTAKQINSGITGEYEFTPTTKLKRAIIADFTEQAALKVDVAIIGEQPLFSLTIKGQIKGGKNNMIITRTGKRFPKPSWAKWRDEAVEQVKRQMLTLRRGCPINYPMNVHLKYVAGDKRRRDMPAIIDAIFHVLEKAGVVTDDTLLWVSKSSRAYGEPMAEMAFCKA